jgi:hypothetical protein
MVTTWLGVIMVAAPAGGQVRYTTVGLTGGVAPGLAGVRYQGFGLPVMNEVGEVAFLAALEGEGVTQTNRGAIFAGAPGSLRMAAREGEPAPGMPAGVIYRELADATMGLNRLGEVAYDAVLVRPASGELTLAVYASGLAGTQVLARGGEAAPGLGGGVTYQFDVDEDSRVALNNDGRTAFFGLLAGPGITGVSDDVVIGASSSGGRVVVAREGGQAAGLPAGVTYGRMFVDGFSAVGGAEHVGFVGMLGGAVTPANDQAVFAGPAGALRLVARKGGAVPGAAGVNYGGFFPQPTLNDAGDVGFWAMVSESGGTQGEALVAGPIDSPVVVARTGQDAPGVAGATYVGLGLGPPTLSAGGDIAYFARVRQGAAGPILGALYAGAPASPQLIALAGDFAPGTASDFYTGAFSATQAMNSAGQVAYLAELNVDADSDPEGVGLFIFDPEIGVSLVARTGELFDVGGGNLRTITPSSRLFGDSIGFVDAWGEHMGSGLGEDGRLTFSLRFTDGSSGVFTATVPEPTGAGWVCVVSAWMISRHRRNRSR